MHVPESRLKDEIQAYIDACAAFRHATQAFHDRIAEAQETRERTDNMQNDILHAVEMTDVADITPTGALRVLERLSDTRRERRDAKTLLMNLNVPSTKNTLAKMLTRTAHLEQTLGDALKGLPTWYAPRTGAMEDILRDLTSGEPAERSAIEASDLFDIRRDSGIVALVDGYGRTRIRQDDIESALRSLAARGGTLRPTQKNRRRLLELGKQPSHTPFGDWCERMLALPDAVNLLHRNETYPTDVTLTLKSDDTHWYVTAGDADVSRHDDLGDALCALAAGDYLVNPGEHLGAARRAIALFDDTLADILTAWLDGLYLDPQALGDLDIETDVEELDTREWDVDIERADGLVHLVSPMGMTTHSFDTLQEALVHVTTEAVTLRDTEANTHLLGFLTGTSPCDGTPSPHACVERVESPPNGWTVDLGDRRLNVASFADALGFCERYDIPLELDALTVWRLQRLADPSDWVTTELKRAEVAPLDPEKVYRVTRTEGVHVTYADDVAVRVDTGYGDPIARLFDHDITNIVWTSELAIQVDMFVGSFPPKGQMPLKQWRSAVIRTHNKYRDTVFA